MTPTLCIAIPTVAGREASYERLRASFERQINTGGFQSHITIVSMKDGKEMSIGTKRQRLYQMANDMGASYTVQWDDDDDVPPYYCAKIMEVAVLGTDCIGYIEDCYVNGEAIGRSLFSKDYPGWIERLETPVHGCVRVRTPFFKTPIKTEICLQAGVADLRYAEDRDFSRRVLPRLKTQQFIPEVMYIYRYTAEGTHEERYGIK